MNLPNVMDAIATHAIAAAAAVDSKFVDVAVGFPAARGRCARVFYGGERRVEHFTSDQSLNSKLVAEAIIVRAYWPVAEYAKARGRALMGEMWSFKDGLRTRVLADSTLDGKSIDLNMHEATTDDLLLVGVHFAVVEIEFVVDASEYSRIP